LFGFWVGQFRAVLGEVVEVEADSVGDPFVEGMFCDD